MKVLILNQAFYPDVASTAQHASDLAAELVRRGHDVTVLASNRAYDNPKQRFSDRETWQGILIRRLPVTAFGKSSFWRRMSDFSSFLLSCAWRLLRTPRFDVVVALTTPPLVGFLAAVFTKIKGGRFVYWVMDLNPDQALAAGVLSRTSPTARLLEWVLRYTLRQASITIVLDRFMRERILARGIPERNVFTIAPWSHDDVVRYDPDGRQRFRSVHGLTEKFVVMYSGNHSPCHPLDTVLLAAQRLAECPDVIFCFIGGGTEHARVQRFAAQHNLPNILCLPYQPLSQLSASLSAADLHVVVMGDPFVGIVHPCKIYNICSLGIPVLYIGPAESHITDLLIANQSSWLRTARHGDVEAVIGHIQQLRSSPFRESAEPLAVAAQFSKSKLLERMVDCVVNPRGRAEQPRGLAEPDNRSTSAHDSAQLGEPENLICARKR